MGSDRFSIEIGGIRFSSKAEAKLYTSKLLHSLEVGDVPDEHIRFLVALLNRHPERREKEGSGVAWFQVRLNQPYNSKGFWVIRRDGSATDFSHIDCISPRSPRTLIMSAFRHEVDYQIWNFKRKTWSREYHCPISGEPFDFDEAEVDHATPSFVALVDQFLGQLGIAIDDVRVSKGDGSIGSRLAEAKVRDAWCEYHKNHANLLLLSRNGHAVVTKAMAS